MITFITLSKDLEKYALMCDNLSGIIPRKCPCEYIRVDGTKYDIPSGYNYGIQQATARKSNYGTVMFIHDDARLWCSSEIFSNALKKASDPETGFVGVAGTTKLSETGCWWQDPSTCLGSVFHPNPQRGVHQNCWPGGAAFYGEALVLDGLLLLTNWDVLERLGGFREDLKGFHFYDIDITLRAHLNGLKNYVVPLPIYHNSIGELSPAWEEARRSFVDTYKSVLPRSIFV
jgi:GT2 family glycosyltransferase